VCFHGFSPGPADHPCNRTSGAPVAGAVAVRRGSHTGRVRALNFRWAWLSAAGLGIVCLGLPWFVAPAGSSAPRVVTFGGLAFTVPADWTILPGIDGYCEASRPRVYVGDPSEQAVCRKFAGQSQVVIAVAPTPPVAVFDPSSPTSSESSHGIAYRMTVGVRDSGIIATFPGRTVSFYATNLGLPGSERFRVAKEVLASARIAS
jgi:hypothetical protein